MEMGKLSSHMWRLNQIIYTKYFWGYVLFWILICLGLWYWLEGNDRLVIEILKGPNLSQNSFLVLSIWLLHWFIIHTFFLAVVYRRRASDFFLEVIRFSSIKLWIRYQIWTCFLYGLILIMVKVLVIQFMLQLPNWDIGVLFIVDSLNACVLVLFCFMLYALGANVQMNFACVSFFLLMIVFGGLFVGNRTNYLFYILNRGNGDIGRDLFLQLLFLVFFFSKHFLFHSSKEEVYRMNEIITLKNIQLELKKTCVFQNLNFSCKQGEIIGITGANGSGKSVLFKLIAGLYSPSYGEVLINGENIVPERKIPANLGALIEEPGFINYYSGFKNLQYLASIRGVVGNQEINDTLKIVGLYEQKDQKVKTYSLGMRKKLGIAQAIMENPSILLLDEPMNALDKSSVENMRTLFRKLSSEKGTTILIASHSEEDIRILCDKVYAIEDKVCTLCSD